ncbi:hypothetical protein JTE90_002187 [Oedothorax gibbosus]|uniref:PH domain-containing protein n=1 Tax=Oedothorax gibbosus TaxID=931172 RepID=A0AAV6VHE6_9ARAC|nr:hypothetical protein JTE90_002187 [Oedothorax gibbosus]
MCFSPDARRRMSSLKAAECRKFSPNIFNKSKCQNCFRGKDAHSNEALESNRATRKVSCCGYLFVAPDWDFSLPANRNKRWQRRWFVLYDDGELAYSVDEHPETVPQAVLDMNCVLEVADAENVTGNPFALAVTCPDKVHFIKGTSKEESKKWFEVLSKFPRNTVCGKYKRNATFPCIKSTPVVKIETPVSNRRDTVDTYSKGFGRKQSAGVAFDPGDDVYPTKDTSPAPVQKITEDKKKQEMTTSLPNENTCLRPPLDPSLDSSKAFQKSYHNPVYLMMSDVPPGKKVDGPFFDKPRCLRRQSSFGKKSDLQKQEWPEEGERRIHKSASVPNASILQREDTKTLLNGKYTVDRAQLKSNLSQIRGDPDGCNPDTVPSYCPSTSEFSTEQSNESGGVFLKKGWLVRQDGGEWSKHWFVLRNSALTFFSDPVAEEAGILDGVPLDLRRVHTVHEARSASGHTFCVVMKDFSKLYLSAVTSKIRANWIRAILQAAHLKGPSEEEKVQSPLPPSPPLARTAISRVKERAKSRSRTRSPKFPLEAEYLSDTTDHSSSSNNPTPREKKPAAARELMSSTPKEESSTPTPRVRRRSSLKLENFAEGRKKAADIKDKLEDSSWSIWLDVSKFCREVESKLDELEERSKGRQELGTLVSSLSRVEERLQRVQGELERAKTNLLLPTDPPLSAGGKVFTGCNSLKREVSRLSGISSQNAALAHQLAGAREENRRLKSELKGSQDASDSYELACASLRRAAEQAEALHRSHATLMAARVDDLTGKLLGSEKSVRQLRQRVAKLEQRTERRRSSLKGKEALSLSKEYEAKLAELEGKIASVEGALKGEGEEEGSSAPQQSLLARLHTLDKKVKDVTETVTSAAEEAELAKDLPPKPKIRLQVNLNEKEESEDWNSLSLSASMTDLTTGCLDEGGTLSLGGCLEGLGRKVTDLVQWLKTSLQLLYAQGHINPFQSSLLNFEASSELSRLVRTLEFVSGKLEESPAPEGLPGVVGRLLYQVILLQEVTNIAFRLSDLDQYKSCVLAQHLYRVQQALCGVEQYIEQKASPVSTAATGGKVSLCHVVAALLFHKRPLGEEPHVDIDALFDEVDSKRRNVAAVLAEFKEKFIHRFCATILELSEDPGCEPKTSPTKNEAAKPLGQKQFLAHISHIIAQVSQSFVTHVSKSLDEAYFLCSGFQYSERWTEYVCKLLQQELSLLSSEIKSLCVRHFEAAPGGTGSLSGGAKCGVLVEYLHCSVSELAQVVAIVAVADGTTVLVKDALYGENSTLAEGGGVSPESLSSFHESVQLRASGALSNLPGPRFSQGGFLSLCSPSEVAHRSVSSLLCFRRSWKGGCQQCPSLAQEVQRLASFKEHVQDLLRDKEKQFEEEKGKLEQELHVAQSNIKRLEVEYGGEVRQLQQLYEQKLSSSATRERYAQEMEQLKSLCERGLSAMDASHQKIVCELERRHQRELEDIMADKERALQEEAHATAIALEAVRKAHSEELQKQIQKFKDEFVLKMNKRFETEAFKKCYEQDLCGVKCEIVGLTEKYSVKCLENATLQEKVELMNQQLKATTTQVVELLAKNQQLQARLTSDALQKQEESII